MYVYRKKNPQRKELKKNCAQLIIYWTLFSMPILKYCGIEIGNKCKKQRI